MSYSVEIAPSVVIVIANVSIFDLKDRLTVHTTVHWVEVQKMKLVFFVRAHVYIYNARSLG